MEMWARRRIRREPEHHPDTSYWAEMLLTSFKIPYSILEGSPTRKKSASDSREPEASSSLTPHGAEAPNVNDVSFIITMDVDCAEARKSRAPALARDNNIDSKDFRAFIGTWDLPKELNFGPGSGGDDDDGNDDDGDDGDDRNIKAKVSALAFSLKGLMGKKIKNEETYKQRLDKLKTKRGNPDKSERRSFEKKLTQAFVNGVLRTCLEIFLEHFSDVVGVENISTAKKEYSTNSSLYLYTEEKADKEDETHHSNAIEISRRHHRNPGAAFFQRGTPVNNEQVDFNQTAREIGMLVSVEAKRTLDHEHSNEALLECERDLVSLTCPVPSTRMRAGFSIITDGVDWYFLRIHWTYDFEERAWLRRIIMSQRIAFDTTAQLACWLWFVFDFSLSEQEFPTGMEEGSLPFTFSYLQPKRTFWSWRRRQEERTLVVTKVFHSGRRFVTSLWDTTTPPGNRGERFVLKQAVRVANEHRTKKLMDYYSRELGFLQELAGSGENIVTIASHLPTPTFEYGMWLDYAGLPLEQLDICGRRGQQLAVIVKCDIWSKALVFLENCRISHGDIHQANVLVCLEKSDEGKAVLIDFESAKKFGSRFEDSPVRLSRCSEAKAEVDKIAVAALLQCLWSPGVEDFGNMRKDIEALQQKGHRDCDAIVADVQTVPTHTR